MYVGTWVDLSCSGDAIALGLEAFCNAACGAFPNVYLVDYSHDGGRTWVAGSGGWLRSLGPHLPYGVLGAVAVSSAGAAVFSDVPGPSGNDADDVQVGRLAPSGIGTTLQMAPVPVLPALPNEFALAACHVLGMEFVGRTGWVYFDDGDVGTPSHQHRLGEPVVWQTTDGGAVWSALSSGPTEVFPSA